MPLEAASASGVLSVLRSLSVMGGDNPAFRKAARPLVAIVCGQSSQVMHRSENTGQGGDGGGGEPRDGRICLGEENIESARCAVLKSQGQRPSSWQPWLALQNYYTVLADRVLLPALERHPPPCPASAPQCRPQSLRTQNYKATGVGAASLPSVGPGRREREFPSPTSGREKRKAPTPGTKPGVQPP